MFTKQALIREEGHPIGQPAPMHLNCECGQKVAVRKPFVEGETCPKCGIVYDHHGWIISRP